VINWIDSQREEVCQSYACSADALGLPASKKLIDVAASGEPHKADLRKQPLLAEFGCTRPVSCSASGRERHATGRAMEHRQTTLSMLKAATEKALLSAV